MALYSIIKATVDDEVNTNGIQYITGEVMNIVLNSLIDIVGSAQVYVNPATTDNPNSPSSPQNPRAYIALPGVYTFFGGLEVTSPLGILLWNGTAWSVTQLPMPSPYNAFRCRTTAALTSSTTITSISIEDVGGFGWTAFAGQWVQLINRRTGVFDHVQLSANLNEGDTTMSVSSYTLAQSFPIGSIVECYPTINMREWVTIPLVGDGLDFVNVTSTWRMPPVETIQYVVYLELLTITRNGFECQYNASPSSEYEYNLDITDRTKIIFGTDFVAGEIVRIKYKQPTIIST